MKTSQYRPRPWSPLRPLPLAVSTGFALALTWIHSGELWSLETLRYASALAAFGVARALASCPVCRYRATWFNPSS